MGFIEDYKNGAKCCRDHVTSWRWKRRSCLGNLDTARNREIGKWKN